MPSIQSFAINAGGNAQIWMKVAQPDGPPTRVLMDYAYGAEAFERAPEGFWPAEMSDADHAAAVKEFKRARQQ